MRFGNSRVTAVVAGAAVVVLLGGTTAYAAGRIGTDDIRNGGVKKPDIAQSAVATSEIVNGSIRTSDLSSGVLSLIGAKADQTQVDALQAQVDALTQRVKAVEALTDELDGGVFSPWASLDESATVVDGKPTLTLATDDVSGTSYETTNLDVKVPDDATVSFHYTLADGAVCTAGAPRMFVKVDDTYINSWDQLLPTDAQCGTDGVVSFVVPQGGHISHAGLVYDNGVPGTVTFSDVTVDGQALSFQ